MTAKFFRSLDAHDASLACALVAAYYLKCFSICGIRPSLTSCIACGEKLDEATYGMESFSYIEGGYACSSCSRSIDSVKVPAAVLLWANALLYSSFDDICAMEAPSEIAFDILQLCQQWCRTHIGSAMKSLRMFMSLYAVAS